MGSKPALLPRPTNLAKPEENMLAGEALWGLILGRWCRGLAHQAQAAAGRYVEDAHSEGRS
jgi:hypothetical protein